MVTPNTSGVSPAGDGALAIQRHHAEGSDDPIDRSGEGQQQVHQRSANGSQIYQPPPTGNAPDPVVQNRMFVAPSPDAHRSPATSAAVVIPMTVSRPVVPPLAMQGEIPPELQAAWTGHLQTVQAYEELRDWYEGPSGPSRVAVMAAARESVLTGAGTFATFGLGVGAAASITNGFTNDIAERLAPGGGNKTIGLGNWHQALVPNGVNNGTGYPAQDNLQMGFIRDSSKVALGGVSGSILNIFAGNGFTGAVGSLVDSIGQGQSGIAPIDPRAVYPDVNPLGPDNLPRDPDTMSRLMATVHSSRLEMKRVQNEYATLKSDFAIRLGSVVFAGANVAVNDATQWPVSDRLGPATSLLVSSLASGLAGVVTGFINAAHKMRLTVDAPVLDARGDPCVGADGRPAIQKLPVFRATKAVIPSDPNRNFFADSYFARNIEAQIRAFKGSRTGMAAVSHYFDQFNKRFAGIAAATLPQVLVNLAAGATRNVVKGNVAGRLIINTAAPVFNYAYAVRSWFTESARLNQQLVQANTSGARVPLPKVKTMQASADSSTALSGALARLDPLQARWQAIVRRAGKLQEGPRLRTEDASPSHSLRLTVHGAPSKLDIALTAGQWPQLLPLLDLQDVHRRDAATNLLLADVVARLRNAGCPVESISGLTDTATSGRNCPRRIAIRLGQFEIDLMPDEDAAPLARALEAALIERMPVATQRLLQWPLRTCVALGMRRMTRARFAALHPGDAVFGGFMDHVHLRIVSAKSRTWVAQARIDKQDTIMITDPFGEEVAHDFEAISEREGPAALAAAEIEGIGLRALARLPMEIRYEIDGPGLSVSEAAELAPGDVLVLPVPVDGAVVHLRCQGRTIARGELVNVGGQLGVRVTEAGERT